MLSKELQFAGKAIETKVQHGKDVDSLVELDGLDQEEVLEGYLAESDAIPIGKSKSYLHGWLNRQVDRGLLPISEAQKKLAHLVIERSKVENGGFASFQSIAKSRR